MTSQENYYVVTKMTCGIYCITNNINGMKYVGQSVCIEERFKQHIHSNSDSEIHKAIEEYGVVNFRFEVLIACSKQELDEQEVKFIRLLDTYENGYNQTRGGQHSVYNFEYDYRKYSELKDEIKQKSEKIRSLKIRGIVLEKKIDTLNDEIMSLKEDNESLKTKNLLLEKILKKNHDETIKPLRKRIAYLEKGAFTSLKNENKKLKSQIKEIRFENEKLLCICNEKKDISESNVFYQIMHENSNKEKVVE